MIRSVKIDAGFLRPVDDLEAMRSGNNHLSSVRTLLGHGRTFGTRSRAVVVSGVVSVLASGVVSMLAIDTVSLIVSGVVSVLAPAVVSVLASAVVSMLASGMPALS